MTDQRESALVLYPGNDYLKRVVVCVCISPWSIRLTQLKVNIQACKTDLKRCDRYQGLPTQPGDVQLRIPQCSRAEPSFCCCDWLAGADSSVKDDYDALGVYSGILVAPVETPGAADPFSWTP